MEADLHGEGRGSADVAHQEEDGERQERDAVIHRGNTTE